MKTYQEQAETYVRQQLPELMELSFGCEVQDKYSKVKYKATDVPHPMEGFSHWDFVPLQGFESAQNTLSYEIIGHPIQLQHWLTAINLPPNSKIENYTDNRFGVWTGKVRVFFDRKSGQPATEADYQAFCEIVGVK